MPRRDLALAPELALWLKRQQVAAEETSAVDLTAHEAAATVTIRDLADTKDRIVASMTGSERTSLTLDET